LLSCSEVVNFVARNDISVHRMASLVGRIRSVQWCCESVGLSVYEICIRKDFVFRFVYCTSLPDWVMTAVNIVHELLQVR